MIKKKCPVCEKDVPRKNKLYCSNKCKGSSAYIKYIPRWKAGLENGMSGKTGLSALVRRYMFKKHNSKCQECGWNKINPTTGRIPLTVDHIDGDYRNNREENLRLLCPNCHSLTSTYGSLNKGKGRPVKVVRA